MVRQDSDLEEFHGLGLVAGLRDGSRLPLPNQRQYKTLSAPERGITASVGHRPDKRETMKMNPLKCAFGVSAGNFLGVLVHQRGIEVDKKEQSQSYHPSSASEEPEGVPELPREGEFPKVSNLAGKIQPMSDLTARMRSSSGKRKTDRPSMKSRKTSQIHQSCFPRSRGAVKTVRGRF